MAEVRGYHKEILGIGQITGEDSAITGLAVRTKRPYQNWNYGKLVFVTEKTHKSIPDCRKSAVVTEVFGSIQDGSKIFF